MALNAGKIRYRTFGSHDDIYWPVTPALDDIGSRMQVADASLSTSLPYRHTHRDPGVLWSSPVNSWSTSHSSSRMCQPNEEPGAEEWRNAKTLPLPLRQGSPFFLASYPPSRFAASSAAARTAPRQQEPAGLVTSHWQPSVSSRVRTSSGTVVWPVRRICSSISSMVWPKQ